MKFLKKLQYNWQIFCIRELLKNYIKLNKIFTDFLSSFLFDKLKNWSFSKEGIKKIFLKYEKKSILNRVY